MPNERQSAAAHHRSPAPLGVADSSHDPQSLAAQNIAFRRDPAGRPCYPRRSALFARPSPER